MASRVNSLLRNIARAKQSGFPYIVVRPPRAGESPPTSRILLSVNDVTKLMLHIINFVSYGVHMLWLGETIPENMDASLAKFSSLTLQRAIRLGFWMPPGVCCITSSRDPRYWPTGPSQYETGKTDLADYLPQRWFD
ncbi:hypothetical protein MY3296_001650 [Beauveria thailandica]